MQKKIVAISDLHGNLPEIPACDILLIAGDMCPVSRRFDKSIITLQKEWLDGPFRKWIENIDAEIFACAGNHDFIFEKRLEEVPKFSWNYLQDQLVEYEGLKIYGTPWQKRFHDWAFNLDEIELEKKWEQIPEGVDVVITHSPPKFFGDVGSSGEHLGSPSLLKRLVEIKPKLSVFGHIHEGRGVYSHNDITLANVAVCGTFRNQMVYEPYVYYIDV